MFGKRGLSDVVSVVLIMMLVVGAVAAMWVFIAPIVKEIQVNRAICSSTPVEVISCQKANMSASYGYSNGFNVGYRYSLESVEGLKEVKSSSIILKMKDGETITADDEWAATSGTRSASFLTSKDASDARIVSTFTLDDGSEQTCDIPAKVCNNDMRGTTDISVPSLSESGNNDGSGSGHHPVGAGEGVNLDFLRYPQLISQISNELVNGQSLDFIYQTEKHSINVSSITSTSATITVQSTPQTATLNIGETKYFDLNSDSIRDIAVKLDSVYQGNASITVTSSQGLVKYFNFSTLTVGGDDLYTADFSGARVQVSDCFNVRNDALWAISGSCYSGVWLNNYQVQGGNSFMFSFWFNSSYSDMPLLDTFESIDMNPQNPISNNIIKVYLIGGNICSEINNTNSYSKVCSSGKVYSDKKWNNIAVGYNSNSQEQILYLNGVEIGRGAVNLTPAKLNLEESFVLGGNVGGYVGREFDEYRFYNRVLGAGEVNALYNSGRYPSLLPFGFPGDPVTGYTPITGPLTLSQPNTVYYLANDVSCTETCIDVTADNITIDGNGHTIHGDFLAANNYYAINLVNRKDIIIKNMSITSYFKGVYIESGSDINISDINTSFNGNIGIHSQDSSRINLKNINSNNNFEGVYLFQTDNSSLYNVTASFNSGIGIQLQVDDSNISYITTKSNPDGLSLMGNRNNLSNINSSSNQYTGLYISGANDNRFLRINSSNNPKDIYFTASSRNVFSDMFLGVNINGYGIVGGYNIFNNVLSGYVFSVPPNFIGYCLNMTQGCPPVNNFVDSIYCKINLCGNEMIRYSSP